MSKEGDRVEACCSILFLCLARDCADTIPRFFSYLRRLESQGFRCAAIIGENGSRDGTRELIKRASGVHIELLDTSFMANTEKSSRSHGDGAAGVAAKGPRVSGGAQTTSASPTWTT